MVTRCTHLDSIRDISPSGTGSEGWVLVLSG